MKVGKIIKTHRSGKLGQGPIRPRPSVADEMKKNWLLIVGMLLSLGGKAAAGGTVENLRTIVNKAAANAVCPAGSMAIYVSEQYRGNSGAEICAADLHGKHTCTAIKHIWVSADNQFGTYAPSDSSCLMSLNSP